MSVEGGNEMTYKAFATMAEAMIEKAKMRGWTVKVKYIYMPEHPLASRAGNIRVLECNRRKYLREDGYVR